MDQMVDQVINQTVIQRDNTHILDNVYLEFILNGITGEM